MKRFLLIYFLSLSIFCRSQLVEGIDLAQYPAKSIEFTKRAPIRWQSNPFKNKVKEIKEGYERNEIGFAGYYITVLWQRSMDTVQGVMIDARTGIIYKLPISGFNSSNRCMDMDDIFDRYLFLPTSRLLVTSTCKKVKDKNERKLLQEFYFYLWNESTKKFGLIKKTSKERML